MTGVQIGLGHRPRHGEFYTKCWIQLLESDPWELVRAASDAWRMSEALLAGARKLKERTAEPSSVHPGVLEAPQVRIRGPRRCPPPLCAPLRTRLICCRRNRALRFVRRRLRHRHGVEEALDGLPTTTRTCRIAAKALYRVLGLSRRLFPCRHYAGHAQGRSRRKKTPSDGLCWPESPARRTRHRGSGDVQVPPAWRSLTWIDFAVGLPRSPGWRLRA